MQMEGRRGLDLCRNFVHRFGAMIVPVCVGYTAVSVHMCVAGKDSNAS